MIPKIIHQIWLGGKSLPVKFQEYQKTWIYFHSNWEFKMWNDKNIRNLRKFSENDYNILSDFSEKSDYIRILVLQEFGGIYADVDIECIKSFDALCKYDFFAGREIPGSFINGALMGATRGNGIIQLLSKGISKQIKKHTNKHEVELLGPPYVTKGIEQCQKGDEVVQIFPPEYFHPKPWNVPDDPRFYTITENTYCIHHYTGSWLPWKQKLTIWLKKYTLSRTFLQIYTLIKHALLRK